jgi:hypothetical protein
MRIAMVVFCALWYGIILPGHERGAITLPGSNCCDVKAASCHTAPHPDKSDRKSDPVRTCAVCQLVSVTAPPTVIAIDVQKLHLLAELPSVAYLSPDLAAVSRPQSGRGPPAAPIA